MTRSSFAAAALGALLLVGCRTDGEITAEGIRVTRSACPGVGIPAGTGDVTLFNPANSRDASAIDVVANITNVRSTCDDSGEYVNVGLNFDVHAQRRDATGARQVDLPYFITVVHSGSSVVSKRVGQVRLQFADGELRTSTSAAGSAQVLRSAATLPDEIRERITRERKAGDPDAALDPMSDPTVRAAVARASFEVLVGFQLTEEQLAYNATR